MFFRRILLLLFVFLFTGCSLNQLVRAPVDSAEQAANKGAEVIQEWTVELQVIFDDAHIRRFRINYTEGLNAFTILEKVGLQLEVKEYSFGKLVDSIDGVQGGTDGKYWIYYVNGAMGTVAAEQYVLKAGDRVEWRFQKEQGV